MDSRGSTRACSLRRCPLLPDGVILQKDTYIGGERHTESRLAKAANLAFAGRNVYETGVSNRKFSEVPSDVLDQFLHQRTWTPDVSDPITLLLSPRD